MFVRLLKFAAVAGLLGEAVELLRLEGAGMYAPSWRLRLTLYASYFVLAGAVFAATALVKRTREGRLALAAGLFAALLFLPWINFDYLPKLASARSLVGNGVVLVLAVLGALWTRRFPRATVVAVLLVGAIANAGELLTRGRKEGQGSGVAVKAAAPNMLIVLIDTLRADHLGAYGYSRPTSPNIDRLALSSVVFDSAFAQSSWTKPSVASLLTGRFVHRHGVVGKRDALGSDLRTLGEEFQEKGYRTAAFSSNPFITPEFRFDRGFDEFFHSAPPSGVQLTIAFRSLSRLEAALRKAGVSLDLTRVLRAPTEDMPSNAQRDEILVSDLVDWLQTHKGEAFFAYAHLIGSHAPYDPPARFAEPFRVAALDGRVAPTMPPSRVQSIFENAAKLDDIERQALIAQYDGTISHSDSLVGRIVSQLEQLGILDRTLLVVTADHGEEFYDHGNWGHGNQMYNELVRVPLLFRLPAALEPGRRMNPAMLIDIYPTALHLTGLTTSTELDGADLFGSAVSARPAVFSEYFRHEGADYASRMVVENGAKLIDTRDDARDQRRREVYDLAADPREHRDLYETGSAASRVGELQERLATLKAPVAAAAVPTTGINKATEERLRALGY